MKAIEAAWLTNQEGFRRYVLAGDIGGTHTNLALFGELTGRLEMLYRCTYPTQEIRSFSEPLELTLQAIEQHSAALRPTTCCISVAGPAVGNTCRLTNASWGVDGDEVTRQHKLRTIVINDFHALSYAIPLLDRNDREQIIPIPHSTGDRPEASGSVMAVIGAGTGLGTSFLIRHGEEYRAYPTEGGHSDFSAFDEETIELKRFVTKSYPSSPGTEPFLAGRGIANIYAFFKSQGMTVQGELTEVENASEPERPAVISRLAGSSPECLRIMRLFVRIYGNYATRAALMYLPTGGLFLAGGIVGKNVSLFLDEHLFMSSFERNYRDNIHDLLMGIPVYIVRDYASSLYGAANAARVLLK